MNPWMQIDSDGVWKLELHRVHLVTDMRGSNISPPAASSTPISERYQSRYSSYTPVRSYPGQSVTAISDVQDRTVVRIRRSGFQQERIRVVCSTRRQHVSHLVTVSDVCRTLPPLRRHVSVIRLDTFLFQHIIFLLNPTIKVKVYSDKNVLVQGHPWRKQLKLYLSSIKTYEQV